MLTTRLTPAFAFALVALATLGACRHQPSTAPAAREPRGRPLTRCVAEVRDAPIAPSESLSVPPPYGMRSDEVAAVVARTMPGGWGGFAGDSTGRLLVRLVDTTQADSALAALARLAGDPQWASFNAWYAPMLPTARVVPTRFDMAQLYDWMHYLQARLLADRPAGVAIRGWGIDLQSTIDLSATDSVAQRRLEAYLGTLGLPCGLVRTSWMAPIYMLPGRADDRRP